MSFLSFNRAFTDSSCLNSRYSEGTGQLYSDLLFYQWLSLHPLRPRRPLSVQRHYHSFTLRVRRFPPFIKTSDLTNQMTSTSHHWLSMYFLTMSQPMSNLRPFFLNEPSGPVVPQCLPLFLSLLTSQKGPSSVRDRHPLSILTLRKNFI